MEVHMMRPMKKQCKVNRVTAIKFSECVLNRIVQLHVIFIAALNVRRVIQTFMRDKNFRLHVVLNFVVAF